MLDEATIHQLRKLLQQHLRVETVGSQVAELLRQHFGPSFQAREHGFANLRTMLAQYIPELHVVGRSGVDLVYRWIDEPGASIASVAPDDAESRTPHHLPTPWSAWATPGSGYNVVLSEDRPRTILATEEIEPHEILLHSTAATEHRAIAGGFLAAHPELDLSICTTLKSALELDDEHWWSAWSGTIRSKRELHSAWVRYRLRELRAVLRRKLGEAGLTEAKQQAAIAAMIPSRKTKPNDKEQHYASAVRPAPAAMIRRDSSETLRSIVLEAVRRMDVEDLRALRIPVGILLEVQADLKA